MATWSWPMRRDLKSWKRKHRAQEAARRSNTQEQGFGGNAVKKGVSPK